MITFLNLYLEKGGGGGGTGRERPGQQFWPDRGIAPAPAVARVGVYTMLYIVSRMS